MATKSKSSTAATSSSASSADQADQADTKLSGGELPLNETGTAAVVTASGGETHDSFGVESGVESTELPNEGGLVNIFDPGTGTYTPVSPEQLEEVAPPPEPEPEREVHREPPRDGGNYSFDPATGIYTRIITE